MVRFSSDNLLYIGSKHDVCDRYKAMGEGDFEPLGGDLSFELRIELFRAAFLRSRTEFYSWYGSFVRLVLEDSTLLKRFSFCSLRELRFTCDLLGSKELHFSAAFSAGFKKSMSGFLLALFSFYGECLVVAAPPWLTSSVCSVYRLVKSVLKMLSRGLTVFLRAPSLIRLRCSTMPIGVFLSCIRMRRSLSRLRSSSICFSTG